MRIKILKGYRPLACVALLFFLLCMPALADQEPDVTLGVTLRGIAYLPADSFTSGPVSGQFINAANGRTVPFRRGQPVQGFSALLDNGDGSFLALVDNGFGTRDNSADFLLRVYRIRPQFRTAAGGAGTLLIESFFTLHDPDHQLPFPVTADYEFYPVGEKNIPVDPRIRTGRLLTGSDFDPESFQRLPDGSLWFGDEFGPWLLHTDDTGRVLEPPVSLPGIMGPDHPGLENGEARVARSGGFEGMAIGPDNAILYPMLEKPLVGGGRKLAIFAFDPASRRFLQDAPDKPWLDYPLDEGSTSIGALTAYGKSGFLVIERDSREGPAALIKRIYRIDSAQRDDLGLLCKKQVVNLLNISDPARLGGETAAVFSFPFWTTESLVVIDEKTIIVLNDNNYPFGRGRQADEGEPDGSEMILLHVPGLRPPACG